MPTPVTEVRPRTLVVLSAGLAATAAAGGYLLVRAANAAVLDLLTDWSGPLWLTLRVTAVGVLAGGLAGVAAGYALAKGRWRGRDVVEGLGSVPMILPPTVLGYYLLTGLGDTWLGRAAELVLGGPVVFHFRGVVVVAAMVAFPYCMRATRTGVERVDPRMEHAARSLGLCEARVAWAVTLPLARRVIGVGLTLGFLRALGEYGATLMVGAAVRGETRTLSVAVTDQRTVADTHAVLTVLVVLAVLALVVMARLQRGTR